MFFWCVLFFMPIISGGMQVSPRTSGRADEIFRQLVENRQFTISTISLDGLRPEMCIALWAKLTNHCQMLRDAASQSHANLEQYVGNLADCIRLEQFLFPIRNQYEEYIFKISQQVNKSKTARELGSGEME